MSSLNDFMDSRKVSFWKSSTIVLFLYGAVVSFALVMVVFKNFKSNTEIQREEQLAVEQMQEAKEVKEAVNMAPPEVYEQEDGLDNALTVDWEIEVQEDEPEVKVEVVEVAKGDNFIGILQKIGMEYGDGIEIVNALKDAGYNVKNLRIGQKIEITKSVDVPFGELLSVDKIVLEPKYGQKYIVERNEDEKYVAEVVELELKSENILREGEVDSFLSVSMEKAGIPNNVVANFSNVFMGIVDFKSEIRKGHKFKVLFERKVASDGKVIKNGDILYAVLDLGHNNRHEVYRHVAENGEVDYYYSNGMVMKRALNRKPLKFTAARISSRYGWRRHPILKKRILHSGVDYAAPKGSIIYASGDGVIRRAEWAGGYGKYIVIRHNSEFSTGYAHLNAFAKGIKPGTRVKQGQVIGYVGSTGRSTGPHLHFEIIKNGKKIDPLKVKAATGVNLQGKELQRFKKTVADINAIAEKHIDVAENNLILKE